MSEKIAPKTISVTLATGETVFAGRTERVSTYEEATAAVRKLQNLISGDQDEKFDWTVAFEDNFVFEGTSSIGRNTAIVDFGSWISRGLHRLASDEAYYEKMKSFVDPKGELRATAMSLLEQYQFSIADGYTATRKM